MVPRKFNIVDFGGFDLAGQYGEVLPGIYDKIVDAHWNCVYIMCFGLKFGGFDIAPQYMTPEMFSDHIMLNGIIYIDQNDVITVPGIEPPVPPPPEPVILPGIFEENGTFNPPSGVDGYAPITVNVSSGGDDPFALANYIQSSGTQWIDTGYIPTLDTHIEIVAKVPNNTGAVNCLLGVRDTAVSDSSAKAVLMYAGATGSNLNTLYCQFSGNQDYYSGAMKNFFDKKVVYRIKRGRYLLANNQWDYNSLGISTGSSVTSTRSIYLFALHNVDSAGTLCPYFLYRVRFYENDTLAMELVPWVDNNNVVCLKDTVSGNLFYNSGTGVFVYGTDE